MASRKKVTHQRGAPGSEKPVKLTRKAYDKHLAKLHVELVKLQEWVKQKGLRVCIVFEGRDGAGKGGTIKAITERVSPRVFRVVALPAPTEREKTKSTSALSSRTPAAGEVVIWDRSWYNRAGVERVMGLCPEEGVKRFLELAPLFENRSWSKSGIILLKYWLEVGMESRRPPARRGSKTVARSGSSRRWTSNRTDVGTTIRARATRCFMATDTAWAPWYVVQSDHKRRARLNVITHILSKVPYEKPRRDEMSCQSASGRTATESQTTRTSSSPRSSEPRIRDSRRDLRSLWRVLTSNDRRGRRRSR